MLIQFNVSNFLSFETRPEGGMEELSMIAGKARNKKEHVYEDGKIKLLRLAIVYGANAAGKSNLVKAIDFMRHVILYGLPEGHTERYCKINSDNQRKPSCFEIGILLNGKYYIYGFEVILSQSKFILEGLVEVHADGTDKILFLRDIANGNFKLDGELAVKGLKEKLEVYAGDIQDDETALLLSAMNQNKKKLYENFESASILKSVYFWFRDALNIRYSNQLVNEYSYLTCVKKIDEISKIISAFGTGITGFKMRDIQITEALQGVPSDLKRKILTGIEKNISKLNSTGFLNSANMILRTPSNFLIITSNEQGVACKTIEFCHGKDNTTLHLEEESEGTIRILDLLEMLLVDEPITYVVDELDRSLHPSLTCKFIETFLQLAMRKNIQLVATTHESRLMDFDLLRRDEIWFVNKRESGASDIYSLEEYNTRFDQKVDKAYLEGRYGAVPIFDIILNSYKELS